MCIELAKQAPVAATKPTPGFKKGDKVRILRKANDNESNWRNTWVREMDSAIGKVGTIEYDYGTNGLRVLIPGMPNYSYPAFVLEHVTEAPVQPVAKKIEAPVFKKGDQVRVSGYHLNWDGDGIVEGTYGNAGVPHGSITVIVKFNRQGFNSKGGFDTKYVTLRSNPSTPAQAPVVAQSTDVQANVQSRALIAARNLAVNLAKQNPAKTVTADWVQDELSKLGYTSADLGNAAGVVFKGGQFRNTGTTVKSVRKGNNRRPITVWEYVGQ